jgi:hypothetical protein
VELRIDHSPASLDALIGLKQIIKAPQPVKSRGRPAGAFLTTIGLPKKRAKKTLGKENAKFANTAKKPKTTVIEAPGIYNLWHMSDQSIDVYICCRNPQNSFLYEHSPLGYCLAILLPEFCL